MRSNNLYLPFGSNSTTYSTYIKVEVCSDGLCSLGADLGNGAKLSREGLA